MPASKPAACTHGYTRSVAGLGAVSLLWCCYCGALGTAQGGRIAWEHPAPPKAKRPR